jgi:muramoyltetrapeptide carboxypeptidase LdcA involved in peptidoglycan recycling
VERNLTHLITARRLINCAGIVVGEHTRCQLVAPNRA